MLINIVDYNHNWAEQFNHLKAVYEVQLSKLIDDIQHVGSTAVPGLAAKPVIDIDLITKTDYHLPAIINQLEKMDYHFQGDMGITGRLAFKQRSWLTPKDGSGTQWPKHHLYVCQQDSIALRNHLIFRDALRNNAALAALYAALKRSMAAHCTDIDQYVMGKTSFILSVLQEKGMDPTALQSIEKDNLGN